ncbi:Rab3 GTPase-activating protein catalytic subunit [Trichoplax sp. H2]|nr:Rab3 GTPase-activating protein catalytic subunit [Trichoplax sp. H2]|eukprot:RDD41035.1 Rab3 GTPase-activating protein catalytic subunit [Trichoplax sp. H2]
MNYFRKALALSPATNSFQRIVNDKRFIAIKAFLNLHKRKKQQIDPSADDLHFFMNIAGLRLNTHTFCSALTAVILKMAEDESADVQEIVDYTTASDWERFIADLDELIIQWKLNNSDQSSASQEDEARKQLPDQRHQEIIVFRECPYSVTHYCYSNVKGPDGVNDDTFLPMMYDMQSTINDFPSRAHCLTRWYGVKEFITITPAKAEYAITSESKGNQLLSAVSICLSNTKCELPIFLQLQQLRRRLYVGLCLNRNFRANFEMVQLNNTPSQYRHLSGLIDIFKSKLCSYIPSAEISVSIRQTYILNCFTYSPWVPQEIPDLSNYITGGIGTSDFQSLPFGSIEDPITDIYLAATWPSVAESALVDNNLYSDLDPYEAPLWSVRAVMTKKPCLLESYLSRFIDVCRSVESTDELIGFSNFYDNVEMDSHVVQALDKITDSSVHPILDKGLARIVSKATNRVSRAGSEESHIPSAVLSTVMQCLFPDSIKTEDRSYGDQSSSFYHNNTATDYSWHPINKYNSNSSTVIRGLKSAPEGSLTHTLAISLCIINRNYGGLRAIAHLWREFIMELRYRWENNIIIPMLELEAPNLQFSLLHQKFQMLNCCILQRRKRELRSHSENLIFKSGNSLSYGKIMRSMLESRETEEEVLTSKLNYSDDREEESVSYQENVKVDGDIYVKDNASSSEDEFFETMEEYEAGEVMEKSEENQSENSKDNTDTVEKHEADKTVDTLKESQIEDSNGATDTLIKPGTDNIEKSAESYDEDLKDVTTTMDDRNDEIDSTDEDDRSDMQIPIGVKEEFNLLLLETKTPMNIPITQDPTPMTEDMLSEQAEILTKLGTSEEGIRIRARMQSASLLSDMEAFKAANPGCILEDFVRWYSPRDWIPIECSGSQENLTQDNVSVIEDDDNDWHMITDDEAQDVNNQENQLVSDVNESTSKEENSSEGSTDESANRVGHPGAKNFNERGHNTDSKDYSYNPNWYTQGHLSTRMRIPGNIWAEVWEAAKRSPAYKQKRLFDDTKEAEKVFHYLNNLKPSEVALQLLSVVVHAAIFRAKSLDLSNLPNVNTMIDSIVSRACRLSVKEHTDLLKDIKSIECIISARQSLAAKFICYEVEDYGLGKLEGFAGNLLNQPEVTIEGSGKGLLGKIINQAFVSSKKFALETFNEPHVAKQELSSSKLGLSEIWAQEFILRTQLSRPVSSSRPTPQRLYSASTKDEFRMAGTFCNDTIFQ